MLNARSCAVIVVPILAPRITEMPCFKVISPALTNPITMTVVALLLCITAVAMVPARTPIPGFTVRIPRIFFIFSPAAFCSDSLIMFIPKIKIASPPSRPNVI